MKKHLHSGNLLKKGRAPLKSFKKIYCTDPWQDQHQPRYYCASKKILICSIGCEIDQICNKIFQSVKKRCKKTSKIIIPEDSQSKQEYKQLVCQLRKNMTAVFFGYLLQ